MLKNTKGHYGARSRLYKTAKQSNIKSLQYALEIEKIGKRNFRSLWITRINAASKELGSLIQNWFLECQKIILLLTEKFYPILQFLMKQLSKRL